MTPRPPFFTYRIDVMSKADIVDLLTAQIIQFLAATALSIICLLIEISCARAMEEFSQISFLRFCLPH
jgi:hypothetical protein